MKRVYICILFLCFGFTHLYASADIAFEAQDTAQVNLLNRQGFQIHLTDHDQTIKKGQEALEIAKKINYIDAAITPSLGTRG